VSLPVSSECKAQRCYESQSRQLKNEGEKIFPRFAWTDRRYAPLYTTFASAHSYRSEMDSYGPAHYVPPPFNIPRSAPDTTVILSVSVQ